MSIFKPITLNIEPVVCIHKNRSVKVEDNSCQQQWEKSEFLYYHNTNQSRLEKKYCHR